MGVGLEVFPYQGDVHVQQGAVALFHVRKVGFRREGVAFRRVAGGAGKDKVPQLVILDERPGDAMVNGDGGIRGAFLCGGLEPSVAVEAVLLAELLQDLPVGGKVVPLRGPVQLAGQGVGILLLVYFLKVLYPLVIVYLLKVRLELDAGGVGMGVEMYAAVGLVERIQLPFGVLVKGSHHVLEHFPSDCLGNLQLQVAAQGLEGENLLLVGAVKVVLPAEVEKRAFHRRHCSPLGGWHLLQVEVQGQVPVDFREPQGNGIIAEKVGFQVHVKEVVQHRLEKSVLIGGGVHLCRRQGQVHNADNLAFAKRKEGNGALLQIPAGVGGFAHGASIAWIRGGGGGVILT